MRPILSVLLLLLISLSAQAAIRDCTAQERDDGNAQLMAIAGDDTRKMVILSRHVPFAINQSTQTQNEKTLYQNGYVMSYDPDLRTAVWVSYRLTRDDVDNAAGNDRVNYFRKDPRLAEDEASRPVDNDEPIFDQGQLANDADMKDNLTEQVNTYVMSNMSPQHCRFNRGIWLPLEALTRIWAKKYGAVLATSGAIFDRDGVAGRDADADAVRMHSNNNHEKVAVPSAYYKVILWEDPSGWKSIAFLLPHINTDDGTTWADVKPDVMNDIVTISEIEEEASMRLFPALNRNELTETIHGSDWDFSDGESNFNGTIHDDSACVTLVN